MLSNLPDRLTSFIGRERQIAEIKRLLPPIEGPEEVLVEKTCEAANEDRGPAQRSAQVKHKRDEHQGDAYQKTHDGPGNPTGHQRS